MEALDELGNVICARCGIKITSKNKSKDHFIPQSFYTNTSSKTYLTCNNNIVYLCKGCNNSIGSKPKTPDWYEYLSDEYKKILYDAVKKFVDYSLKTNIGKENLAFYKDILDGCTKDNSITCSTEVNGLIVALLGLLNEGQDLTIGSRYKILKTNTGLVLNRL